MNQKAALVCNNYKVESFKKALIKAGYPVFIVTPLKGMLASTTNIIIYYPEEKQEDLTRAIKLMELNFQTQN